MKTVEEHYKVLAPRLTNWLVASGSSYAEACDIVQDTFVKIWDMRNDLQEDDNAVSGLVFTIARNIRKNLVRAEKHLVLQDEIGEDEAGTAPETNLTPDDERDYLRRKLVEAFAKLPPILRDAYTLFQVAEMPISEIAVQTGVSENLVKVRIFRAKEKLRELLANVRKDFC